MASSGLFIMSGGGSGSSSWSSLTNPTANLALSMAGFTTTFNQTSAVNWIWANTNASFTGTLPTLIASGVARAHASSGQVTLNTTGATLLVAVLTGNAVAATISDSAGNTWNYLTTQNGSASKTRIAYAFAVITNAADVFTVAGDAFAVGIVYAFSGTLTTSGVFDAQEGATSTGTTVSAAAGTITPGAGDIVVCGWGSNSGSTTSSSIAGAGFSASLGSYNVADEVGAASYLINASSSAINPVWTMSPATSVTFGIVLATFKAASSTTVNASSPLLVLQGNWNNGSSNQVDSWTLEDVLSQGGGGNVTSQLSIAYSGSAPTSLVSVGAHVYPSADNTYDLGTGTLALSQRWRNIGVASTIQWSPTLYLKNFGSGSTEGFAVYCSNGSNAATPQFTVNFGGGILMPVAQALGWSSLADPTGGGGDIYIARAGIGLLVITTNGSSTNTASLQCLNITQQNFTAATSSVSQSSPTQTFSGKYWDGAASQTDSWTIQDVIANGTNGTSTLTFTHSGSTGAAAVSVPVILAADGTKNNCSFAFATSVSTGLFKGTSNRLIAGSGGTSVTSLNAADGFGILNSFGIFFTTSVDGTGKDTGISRQAAGVVAIGNGTNADTTGNLQLNQITKYNGETTAGPGVGYIRGSTSQKNETGADASVLSVTPPAVAGGYRLTVVLSLSAANAATIGWTATWTDSNGNAQTPTNLALLQTGAAAPALTFTTSAAGNYYGSCNIDINNAGTAIVIKTTFSGTSVAYKVSATIERII